MKTPSRRAALGAAAVGLVAPLLVATPAAASTTANEVVYTADDNNDGIYGVVLRDLGTRRVSVVLPPDTTNNWLYDDPELSPDGSRIALSTDRGGGTDLIEGIAVVNRDGSGFRRLTTPPTTETDTATTYTLDVGAAWSPDGSQILFTRIAVTSPVDTSQEDTIDTTLFTVPAAGGTATAVPGAGDGYTGDWSPDGSKIVFAAIGDAANEDSGPLTVVDRSGARTPLGVTGYSPAWSPDGSTIAYATVTARDSDASRGHDTAQIATVPATGGTQRVLAPTRPGSAPTVAEYPAWLPDGESLVYDLYGYSATDDFPPGDLWAIDRNGVRAGKVTATAGDEAQPHVQGPAPRAVAPGTSSTYVPVTPDRVLDTRPAPYNVGVTPGKIGPQGSVNLQVRGLTTNGTTIPAEATAVVLNVTVTGTTAATDIRVFPSGSAPTSSNLNAGPSSTVPNLVTVSLGSNGGVTLRNSAGSTHLFVDIAGYYVSGTGGAGFAALDPGRILDTRNGTGAARAKVGAKEFIDLTVRGDALPTTEANRTVRVPADATAVVLNVTGTNATELTDVRVYPTPTDGSVPTVSNLNFKPGLTTPNLVTVPVGADGKVRLRNAAGTVDLLADIAGYYSPSAAGRFVPVTPSRFLDTRTGVGGAPIPTTAAGWVDLRVGGTRGVPAGTTAAVLNITGTSVSSSTDVRAFPATSAGLPTVSNLNLTRGATRANLAIVKAGSDGRIRIRNAAGELHLIADLAGYMVG